MTNDIEDLLKAISQGQNHADLAIKVALNLPQAVSDDAPAKAGSQSSGSQDVSQLATEVSRLAEATRANMAQNVAPPKSTRTTSSSNETSPVETILRTAGMLTGMGPIVSGIMKLFGSGEAEPLPELPKFEMPGAVSLEAGLNASRNYGSVRYTQDGRPEASNVQPQAAQTSTIQVNIQALDSQSFLDRREDIAKAVREAMLHSNSLNDVVQEL